MISQDKVAGVGAGHGDGRNIQGCISGVGQGDCLRRTGGTDRLAGESEAGGGSTGNGGCDRSGKGDGLWAASVVVGYGHGRGASSRRSEERRVGKECRSRWS